MTASSVLKRTGSCFRARDVAVLDLLRPHLVAALDGAREAEVADALRCGMADLGAEIVVLGDRGEVLEMSTGAADILERHTGLDVSRDEQLPVLLPPCAGELEVRAIGRSSLGPRLVLLRERVRGISSHRLRELGLTPRESEVLAMAAGGARNADIASALFISPHTAKTHLERIYRKLGVGSRGEAVAVALSTRD